MKQMVFRNSLGNNPRKYEISLEEISDRYRSTLARKIISKYFVKDKYQAKDQDDAQLWIELNKRSDMSHNCHILTTINSRTGDHKMICKAMGNFYIIIRSMVYKLVYINEVRIQIKNVRKVKNEG